YTLLNIYFSSLLLGIFLGIAYGRSFAFQQRSVLRSNNPSSQFLSISLIFFFIRLALITACWIYVLQSSLFNPILVLIAFIISFWITLLTQKVHKHAGTRPSQR